MRRVLTGRPHRCDPECYICVCARGGTHEEAEAAFRRWPRYQEKKRLNGIKGKALRIAAEAIRESDRRYQEELKAAQELGGAEELISWSRRGV